MEFPPAFEEFPRKENCDPTNPYQAFLWMFVALPGQNGGPLIMPVDYMQMVSKRLWDLGARPVADPTLVWVPPTGTEPNWMTTPGTWLPVGSIIETTEHQKAQEAISQMTMQQKAELLEALTQWEIGFDMPDTPAGQVSKTLSDGQKRIVLDVLKAERDSA
jgi:hypothetical protein